ncbi:MAG: bacteriohemerythrin [Bacteroidales bacterium]
MFNNNNEEGMALFVWKENYSVKVKSIDDQHKKLIDMINEFYDNITHRSNKENVTTLLTNLKKYVEFHFSLEERYMVLADYQGYNQHKKEHEKFTAKIADLEERITTGKLVLSLEVTTFLKDWLINHILVSDQKYSEVFAKKKFL